MLNSQKYYAILNQTSERKCWKEFTFVFLNSNLHRVKININLFFKYGSKLKLGP